MNLILIVPEITPRLLYTIQFIFTKELGVTCMLQTEVPADTASSLILYYGGTKNDGLNIPNAGLLFDNTIQKQAIALGAWKSLPALFFCGDKNNFIDFDIFSAVFFLLSRYEEYLPFNADKHHRFPATESVLYKNDLLERPIADEWIFAFGKLLETHGLKAKKNKFKFLPTYDIDIAWSYKNKSLKRTLGGYLKDTSGRNFDAVRERTSVLRGNLKDPYDSFDFTNELHESNELKPLYFILAAKENGPFDKHILPYQRNMKALIKSLSNQYTTGMHPSYNSSMHPDLFADEKNILQEISGKIIAISRQHYIRFSLPETYRTLIQLGVRQDYSMGYGTHLGFRAGTSKSFFWYDLKAEKQTALEVFSFSFMDTTARYELNLSAEEAFEKLREIEKILQDVGGLLITIFHNFSLGSAKEWAGWADAYAKFIKK